MSNKSRGRFKNSHQMEIIKKSQEGYQRLHFSATLQSSQMRGNCASAEGGKNKKREKKKREQRQESRAGEKKT